MVRRVILSCWLLAIALPLLAEATPKPLDYQPGDTAVSEVATPISLIVIDPKATESLRQKEALRVPAIFRFDPTAADDAETVLNKTFTNVHRRFMKDLRATFSKKKLEDADFATPQFVELTNVFQTKNKTFPLTPELVKFWAKGDKDEPIRGELVKRIRAEMSHYLIDGPLRGEAKAGPPLTLVINTGTNGDQVITLAVAEQRGVRVAKTNLMQIVKARQEVQKNLPPELKAMGKFLAASVRVNCIFDPNLTQQSRSKKTEPIWAADHYEPGQVIVKKGQMVDAKIKAALDQLKSRTAVDDLQAQLSQDKSTAQTAIQELQAKAATAQLQVQATKERTLWLMAGLSLILLVTLSAFWRLRGMKPAASLAVATIPSVPAAGELSWAQSTGKAEALKAGLLPHFARLLKEQVVMRLVSHRANLLETQQAATTEISTLEERLEKIHAPLEERLKAYEKRITELEKELEVKGEENRELIKAKILLAKKQLEAERNRNRVPWN